MTSLSSLDGLRSLQLRHLPLQLLDLLPRRMQLLNQARAIRRDRSRLLRVGVRSLAGDGVRVSDVCTLEPLGWVAGVGLLRVRQLVVYRPPACDDAVGILAEERTADRKPQRYDSGRGHQARVARVSGRT